MRTIRFLITLLMSLQKESKKANLHTISAFMFDLIERSDVNTSYNRDTEEYRVVKFFSHCLISHHIYIFDSYLLLHVLELAKYRTSNLIK